MNTVQTNKSELSKLGLKALITMAENLGLKYNFQKKSDLVDYIAANSTDGAAVVSEVAPVSETNAPDTAPVADTTAKPKAKAKAEATKKAAAPKASSKKADTKKEDVKAASEDAETVDQSEVGTDLEEVAPEEVTTTKKAGKKASDKKVGKDSPQTGDIESIKKKAGVMETLELKTKDGNDQTKSEKIRRLHFRNGLTIGEVAKVMGIHYSFAYCVIDSFRKSHGK